MRRCPSRWTLWLPTRALAVALLSLSASGSSIAAIIYSGLEDIPIPTNFDGIYLDIETGATATAEFAGWDVNPFFGGFGVANSPAFQPARTGTGNEDPIVRYGIGDTIGGSLLYSADFGGSSSHLGDGDGQFGIGEEGYLAFRLITNGGLSWNYGWMRVIFTANTSGALIKDWAYEDSGAAIVAGRVEQAPAMPSVQWTTFSPGAGETFAYGSLLADAGGGIVTNVLKTGAGTTVFKTIHSYTGMTAVSGGVLEVANGGRLSGTSQVTVNGGGTLLFSGSGGGNSRVNGSAAVNLDGGTLSTGGMTSSLDQQFGVLTLSQDSTIDLSLLAAGNTFRFADSSLAVWAPGATLRIFNYTIGTDHLFAGTNSGGLMASQLNAIKFYSDNGVTLLNAGSPQFIGSGEISPVVVPEPSGLVLAMGIIGLAGWRERRLGRARCREERTARRKAPSQIKSTRFPSCLRKQNHTPTPKNHSMNNSIRLLLLSLAAAAGIGAFQGTAQAVSSTQLITICFRGNTIQVPFYLRFRYFAAGGYGGTCLVSAP